VTKANAPIDPAEKWREGQSALACEALVLVVEGPFDFVLVLVPVPVPVATLPCGATAAMGPTRDH
jgi:hypothetical protein